MPIGRDKEERKEIMIGALVIAVVLAIGAWILYWHSGPSGYDLQVRVPKADGLSVNTDVRIAGMKVGAISSLSVDPNTYFAIIHMNIQSKFQLPTDSAMEVASNQVSGDSYITIIPGTSKIALPPGGTIVKSCGAEDVMSMIGRVGLGNGMSNCPKH